MSDICNDNRFELIEKYLELLKQGTNIETSYDEMQTIGNILFRFWQMGWLDKIEFADNVVQCKDCKYREKECFLPMSDTDFCSCGERRESE